MKSYIKSIKAAGVHNRFDIEQTLLPGVNILFGRNGTGKTTLLHILANVLNNDYYRFVFLNFHNIEVELNDGSLIELCKNDNSIRFKFGEIDESFDIKEVRQRFEETSRKRVHRTISDKPIISVDYFPAFRNIIEAWSSIREDPVYARVRGYYDSELTHSRMSATTFARELFGDFVPRISYPSPIEIEEKLTREIWQARLEVGEADRNLLSRSFQKIYEVLAKEKPEVEQSADEIIRDIQSLSEKLRESLSLYQTKYLLVGAELQQLLGTGQLHAESQHIATPILDVYRKSLEEMLRVQDETFTTVRKYLDSVNQFLEGKRLEIKTSTTSDRGKRDSLVALTFEDGTTSTVRALSSGERQILCLIYAATHMRKEEVVLIDEPEISLHIDWQRKLLPEMTMQLEDRQIIACTHSPMVGADYADERVFELSPKPSRRSYPVNMDVDIEEEDITE